MGDMTSCLDFVVAWGRNLQRPALQGLKVRAIYIWEDVLVTMHMYNPFVEELNIRHFLHRFCLKVEWGQKICNAFGIWTRRRKYQVHFLHSSWWGGIASKVFCHWAIGFLYYSGHPVTYRECGAAGHTKPVFNSNKCHFCGSQKQVSAAFSAPKKCSLCGGEDHLYRGCALRKIIFADLFSMEDWQIGGVKSPA